jgi:hypothetical protein
MQQSPCFGVITWPHFLHWYLIRQKSVGIRSSELKPHFGHVTTESNLTSKECHLQEAELSDALNSLSPEMP